MRRALLAIGRAVERAGLRLQWFALDPSWRVGGWVVFGLGAWEWGVRPQTGTEFATASLGPVRVTFQHPDAWDYAFERVEQ